MALAGSILASNGEIQMSISDNDVMNALNALRSAMEALSTAIAAQSRQVRELAEENQRLHDTVKNRDETIAYMRDRNESLKQGNVERDNTITRLSESETKLKAALVRSEQDANELLRANLEASDEIKGLRQLILEVTLTTAKANELGTKPKPEAPIPTPTVASSVAQLPTAVDPASNYAG